MKLACGTRVRIKGHGEGLLPTMYEIAPDPSGLDPEETDFPTFYVVRPVRGQDGILRRLSFVEPSRVVPVPTEERREP